MIFLLIRFLLLAVVLTGLWYAVRYGYRAILDGIKNPPAPRPRGESGSQESVQGLYPLWKGRLVAEEVHDRGVIEELAHHLEKSGGLWIRFRENRTFELAGVFPSRTGKFGRLTDLVVLEDNSMKRMLRQASYRIEAVDHRSGMTDTYLVHLDFDSMQMEGDELITLSSKRSASNVITKFAFTPSDFSDLPPRIRERLENR